MTWIKQNTFLFGLGVTAVVGALILWLLGASASGRYDDAQNAYDDAYSEVNRFEKLPLYPKPEHVESKKIAVDAYSEQTDTLQKSFEGFRPEKMENITPQAFADAVKRANEETRAAFGNQVKIPDEYFCGFESYRTAYPPGNATGILNYQLSVLKQIMLDMAESGVTQLVGVHRPKLPEEENKTYEPASGEVARKLPLELVFQGPEAAYRDFLSSLVNNKDHFIVVRSIRMANSKLLPPRKTDARFEGRANRPAGGGGGGAGGAGDLPDFDNLFNPTPDAGADAGADAAAAEGEGGAEAAPAPAPIPVAPAPVAGDSSRILAQVLGQEEVEVFVRLDILLFSEPKELP